MKKIIVIFLSICLITGCNKINNKYQEKIISNLGVTSKEQIVVKYNRKKDIIYEVYSFKDNKYLFTKYIFYPNEKEYKKDLDKYTKTGSYEVKTYDEAFTLGIIIKKDGNVNNKTYTSILNKYKNRKYTIVRNLLFS